MLRIIDFRCIIEKHDTHEKYYPKIVSFNTMDSLPLTNAPDATINVISTSNLNDVATVSQVEFDDIVRLQVSTRYNIYETQVWVDIFEGRVQNQSKKFSPDNDIELSCSGHIQEAFYKLITTDATYTSQDAAAILQAVTNAYCSRITYNSAYVPSGLLTVPEYNDEAMQNYVIDVYQEMEKLSGYKKIIDVVPTYSTNGNLNHCYLRWRNFPTTPTKQYAIIEGMPRLISATFDIVGDEVANYRYVRGATYQDANKNQQQYSGSDSDSASVSKYEKRDKVDTFSWVQSTQLCNDIAGGLVDDTALPYVAGTVMLEGTPGAHIGDLVPVYIPSLQVRNSEINGNYTVYKVRQSYNGGVYTTSLDVGKIKKDAYDYLYKNITKVVKITAKNQCRCAKST